MLFEMKHVENVNKDGWVRDRPRKNSSKSNK